MSTARDSITGILSDIQRARVHRIGIDGVDGAGKSTLARKISESIDAPVVSIDAFVEKNKGEYAPFVDLGRLRAPTTSDKYIVEGVCLLDVLLKAGLAVDYVVYVQRMRHGYWADEEFLGLDQVLDDFLEKERYVTAKFSGVPESEVELGLDKEIIQYHHAHRPHEAADIIFARHEDQ